MKKQAWLILVLVILFGAYELYAWKKNNEKPITSSGQVEALKAPILSFSEGKLGKVFVKEGDAVKKGQLLACLNTEDLEEDYTLFLKKQNEQQKTTDEAVYNLFKCESHLNVKDNLLEASKFLYNSGCISKEELDEVIKDQHRALEKYSEAWKERFNAESDLAKACTEVDKALSSILNSKIYSDFSGVIENSYYKENELIKDASKLFSIVDKANLIMSTSLNNKQIKKIHLGDKATIRFDDIKDAEFEAKVIHISKEPVGEEQEYKVKLEIDHSHKHPIRAGMNGMVIYKD